MGQFDAMTLEQLEAEQERLLQELDACSTRVHSAQRVLWRVASAPEYDGEQYLQARDAYIELHRQSLVLFDKYHQLQEVVQRRQVSS